MISANKNRSQITINATLGLLLSRLTQHTLHNIFYIIITETDQVKKNPKKTLMYVCECKMLCGGECRGGVFTLSCLSKTLCKNSEALWLSSVLQSAGILNLQMHTVYHV